MKGYVADLRCDEKKRTDAGWEPFAYTSDSFSLMRVANKKVAYDGGGEQQWAPAEARRGLLMTTGLVGNGGITDELASLRFGPHVKSFERWRRQLRDVLKLPKGGNLVVLGVDKLAIAVHMLPIAALGREPYLLPGEAALLVASLCASSASGLNESRQAVAAFGRTILFEVAELETDPAKKLRLQRARCSPPWVARLLAVARAGGASPDGPDTINMARGKQRAEERDFVARRRGRYLAACARDVAEADPRWGYRERGEVPRHGDRDVRPGVGRGQAACGARADQRRRVRLRSRRVFELFLFDRCFWFSFDFACAHFSSALCTQAARCARGERLSGIIFSFLCVPYFISSRFSIYPPPPQSIAAAHLAQLLDC